MPGHHPWAASGRRQAQCKDQELLVLGYRGRSATWKYLQSFADQALAKLVAKNSREGDSKQTNIKHPAVADLPTNIPVASVGI